MRKWIPFAIFGIGILFVAAGCTPTKAGTSNCTPTNTDGAETVVIAGATFKMGSLAADPGGLSGGPDDAAVAIRVEEPLMPLTWVSDRRLAGFCGAYRDHLGPTHSAPPAR